MRPRLFSAAKIALPNPAVQLYHLLEFSSLPTPESQALIHEIGNQSERYSCHILYAFALAEFWLRRNRSTSAVKEVLKWFWFSLLIA